MSFLCRRTIRECRALPNVTAGRIETAIAKCRSIWASLPGAGYDQPERSVAWLQSQYTSAGGVLA